MQSTVSHVMRHGLCFSSEVPYVAHCQNFRETIGMARPNSIQEWIWMLLRADELLGVPTQSIRNYIDAAIIPDGVWFSLDKPVHEGTLFDQWTRDTENKFMFGTKSNAAISGRGRELRLCSWVSSLESWLQTSNSESPFCSNFFIFFFLNTLLQQSKASDSPILSASQWTLSLPS